MHITIIIDDPNRAKDDATRIVCETDPKKVRALLGKVDMEDLSDHAAAIHMSDGTMSEKAFSVLDSMIQNQREKQEDAQR